MKNNLALLSIGAVAAAAGLAVSLSVVTSSCSHPHEHEHATPINSSENLDVRVTKRRKLELNYHELTTTEYEGCRWMMYKSVSGGLEIQHLPSCPGLAHK